MKKLLLSHMNSKLFNTLNIKDLQKNQNFPIFITNESKHEVLKWHKELIFCAPFIVENGSAIYIPKEYDNLDLSSYPPIDGWHRIVLGKPHDFINAYLLTIKDKYSIKISPSFKENEFSKVFSINDHGLIPVLNEEASLFGLTIKKMGSLFCALGKGASEEGALQILTAIYKRSGHEVQHLFLKT